MGGDNEGVSEINNDGQNAGQWRADEGNLTGCVSQPGIRHQEKRLEKLIFSLNLTESAEFQTLVKSGIFLQIILL